MYLHKRICLGLMLAVVVVSLVMSPLVGRSKARAESEDLWRRVKRVAAYGTSAPERYRYLGWGEAASDAVYRGRWPALTKTPDGMVVCLFTRQSEEQEAAGRGDIVAIYSRDRGESWTKPVVVYEQTVGEPRTMGTLTTLASGKLVAAIAEVDTEEKPQLVCLLTSEDGGQSWQVSVPLDFPDMELEWACPYGKLIERSDGTLLVPVFGVSSAEGQEGVQCVGLMRSTDGGQSWDDFSLIARGFTHPAVLSTGDNSLVALVTSGERLYRCASEDGGYHWSSPQQVLLGREPQLIRISDQALACVSCEGTSWGSILVSFSYDDGKSWRCDRKAMEHPRHGGYFGWPTGLALDAEHMLIVFGEEERIEVVFFERDRQAPELPRAEWIIPPAQRDRWEYVESRQLDMPLCHTADGELIGLGGTKNRELWRSSDDGRTWQKQPMNLPPPGFRGGTPNSLIQLSSGRLLVAFTEWLVTEAMPKGEEIIGYRGGYALINPDRGTDYQNRVYVIYSDDEGRTWQGTEEPIDISPLGWAALNVQFIERADGTVVLPVFGGLSEQDTRERLDSTGLFPSTDGGESWGDFSVVTSDQEHRWTAYNEFQIAPVSDQLWVAFMRTEYRGVPNEAAWMSRAISTDGGDTWSPPELCFSGGVPHVQMLPDGGIAVGHSGGVHLTYDLGRTWSRILPLGGYAVPILLDNDTLAVGNGQNWGSFDVYRRIPPGPGGAE